MVRYLFFRSAKCYVSVLCVCVCAIILIRVIVFNSSYVYVDVLSAFHVFHLNVFNVNFAFFAHHIIFFCCVPLFNFVFGIRSSIVGHLQ